MCLRKLIRTTYPLGYAYKVLIKMGEREYEAPYRHTRYRMGETHYEEHPGWSAVVAQEMTLDEEVYSRFSWRD